MAYNDHISMLFRNKFVKKNISVSEYFRIFMRIFSGTTNKLCYFVFLKRTHNLHREFYNIADKDK